MDPSLPLPPLPAERHLRAGRADLRRRLLVWVGLPAVLAVAYALSTSGRPVGPVAVMGLLLGFVATALGLFLLSARELAAFTRANAAATELVNQGRLAEACAAFEENARRFPAPALHPTSVFNLADAELQRGDARRALQLAGAVARNRSVLRSPVVAASAPSLVATCYGLLGELDAARAWLPEATRAAATLAVEVARVPEAIVACREGRFLDVVNRFRERRRAIEATLAGDDLRTLRLLRAFALAALPGDVASEQEREAARLLARPGAPGECDHLAHHWPELATFLHELEAGRDARLGG